MEKGKRQKNHKAEQMGEIRNESQKRCWNNHGTFLAIFS